MGWIGLQFQPTQQHTHTFQMFAAQTLPETTCRGGALYGNRSYTIRMKPEFYLGNAERSEALLVKTGPMTDLRQIRVRDQDGKTFTDIKYYVGEHVQKSRTTAFNVWHCVEVLLGEEWESGSRFYTLTQPSADAPFEPPIPESEPLPPLDKKLYTKLRYRVRISPKSAGEPWYEHASKDGEISVANHNELYRTEVRSGGKYYTTLWGWLMDDRMIYWRGGNYCGDNGHMIEECPWKHIDALVGKEWVDGDVFCEFRQQICSEMFK